MTEGCAECGGAGQTVQGWTDKNGHPEDQCGPCRSCRPRKRIEELIDRSSFGTPAAKAARASVEPDRAWRVVERSRVLQQIEEAKAEHRREWAEYLESWLGAVGPTPPTVETVITALRLPSPPFGVMAADCHEEDER